MRPRRGSASLAALGLSLLTIGAAAPPSGPTAGAAGPSFDCSPTARPANLKFKLKDLDNAGVKLSAFRGKVILLDFWATWCGPCKIEIPWFVDLQTRYGSQGFQVLGISVDDTLATLKPYAAQYKMNYPVLQGLGHDDVQEAFGPLEGIPTTFLISRDGRICATHFGLTGKDSFETEIQALLQGGQ
jgi:thiol-disulfide isomerase/thioredoxin